MDDFLLLYLSLQYSLRFTQCYPVSFIDIFTGEKSEIVAQILIKIKRATVLKQVIKSVENSMPVRFQFKIRIFRV